MRTVLVALGLLAAGPLAAYICTPEGSLAQPQMVAKPSVQSLSLQEIPWGWYNRADSKAVGSGITAHNMSLGETGVRCMCAGDEGTEEHTGFWVRDNGDGTFVVAKAPKGYSDTVGRRFSWKRSECLSCAD